MDNGHQNAIFSSNPEVDDNLNEENWQKSLEISRPVDLLAPEKIATTEDTEPIPPENTQALGSVATSDSLGENASIFSEAPATQETSEVAQGDPYKLGQITSVPEIAPLQSETTTLNTTTIRTTGDSLDKGSLREIEKLENKLSQDGNLNSFYDEARNLTAVNLDNSFDRKLYDNGGEN